MIFLNKRQKLDNLVMKTWKKCLVNFPCFVIGNSPTINDFDLNKIQDSFSVGINKIIQIFDPSVLMIQDYDVYRDNKTFIKKSKSVLYFRRGSCFEENAFYFDVLIGNKIPNDAKNLYGKGITGPLAVQFANILGCYPIIMIGCDCVYKNGMTDFYGVNKNHTPFTLENCRRSILQIDKNFPQKIIHIHNTNEYDDVVEKYKSYFLGRKFFTDRLGVKN